MEQGLPMGMNLNDARDMNCDCGNNTFMPGFRFKKMSKLITGQAQDDGTQGRRREPGRGCAGRAAWSRSCGCQAEAPRRGHVLRRGGGLVVRRGGLGRRGAGGRRRGGRLFCHRRHRRARV